MKIHNCIYSWRGKFSLLLTACLFTIPFAVVTAKDLTWTGSTGATSNAWDNAITDNWVLRETTTKATFADGDNVLIESGKYIEPSIMMTRRDKPGDVVFDIAAGETFSFGWNNNAKNGLHVDTKSFTKRGSGTLLLRSDLGGSAKSAAGDTTYGNAMTCGVDIVEGQIACLNRNSHNYLGPRTIPYWVYVRDGASLSFLEGNQTGTVVENECGIKIQLDEGGTLNHCTNIVTETADGKNNMILSVNTLKLNGGDIVNGLKAYAKESGKLGGSCLMKIFNTLWFSGATPHAFGFNDGDFPGLKTYTPDGTFKGYKVSLNPQSPVEFRVDDIADGVDTYINMIPFTWGTNTLGQYRCDIVKTGAGTLCFPSNTVEKAFKGDFTVREGTVVFKTLAGPQNFFRAECNDSLQTITISTGATMRVEYRNITNPGQGTVPNIKFVVDHGTLEFVPRSGEDGLIAARDWVFDDANLDIHSKGLNDVNGVFSFRNSVTFKGTRPLVMWPDESVDKKRQAVNVYNGYGTMNNGTENGPVTIFDVADMTGDGRTDVVMGYHIWNGNTNNVVLADSGFIKTGPGTFSVASTSNKVSGVVTVSNGTMRVDGSLTTPSSVLVAVGAYLGGTGTVARVTMEAGSGFDAPAGQDRPLTVNGDLSLPATGVVNISNLGGYEGDALPAAQLVTATGTLSGEENLANWIVTVNGEKPERGWKLRVKNGVVEAKIVHGLVISYR